jgi:hypothetical protein
MPSEAPAGRPDAVPVQVACNRVAGGTSLDFAVAGSTRRNRERCPACDFQLPMKSGGKLGQREGDMTGTSRAIQFCFVSAFGSTFLGLLLDNSRSGTTQARTLSLRCVFCMHYHGLYMTYIV